MDNSGKLAVDAILSAVGEMTADVKHFGVKGMKWGVRKDQMGREIAKSDMKWDKSLNKAGGKSIALAVQNVGPEVKRINEKPEYKGKDTKSPGPLKDKYLAEHAKAFENQLNKELAGQNKAVSPTGVYTATFKTSKDFSGPPILDVTYTDKSLSQSSLNEDGSATIDTIIDGFGHIVGYSFDVEFLEQGSMFADEFLEHFGVKGMRWGVRRSRKQLARAAKEREGSESSSNSARASKTKSKKESKLKVSEMSDAELRQRLNRMNMEKQYRELTAPKGNPVAAAGKKVASNVVKGVAEQTLKSIGQSYASKYTADYLAGGKKAFDKKSK